MKTSNRRPYACTFFDVRLAASANFSKSWEAIFRGDCTARNRERVEQLYSERARPAVLINRDSCEKLLRRNGGNWLKNRARENVPRSSIYTSSYVETWDRLNGQSHGSRSSSRPRKPLLKIIGNPFRFGTSVGGISIEERLNASGKSVLFSLTLLTVVGIRKQVDVNIW